MENLTDATNSSVTLTMRASGSNVRNVYLKAINTSGSGEPQDLAFGTNAAYSASTEKMRLTSGGNLLLGTTTDGGILEVDGAYGDLKIGDPSIGTRISYYDTTRILMNSADIKFYTNSLTERMTIEANGNVGIGTTAPEGKMHIKEASAGSFVFDGNADTLIVESNTNGGITIATAAANSGSIIFASPNDATSAEIKYNNSTNLMYVGTTYGGGGSLILQAGSGVEAMRILANGSCLIGTTTDDGSSKLQVLGDVTKS